MKWSNSRVWVVEGSAGKGGHLDMRISGKRNKHRATWGLRSKIEDGVEDLSCQHGKQVSVRHMILSNKDSQATFAVRVAKE
jgi:hypothetical protein